MEGGHDVSPHAGPVTGKIPGALPCTMYRGPCNQVVRYPTLHPKLKAPKGATLREKSVNLRSWAERETCASPKRLQRRAGSVRLIPIASFQFIAVSGTPEIPPLQIGDRVQLSALGLERSPRMTRTGVIVGVIGSSFEVLMDGSKVPVRLHRTYLEKADA
jgi:hypothetical protein